MAKGIDTSALVSAFVAKGGNVNRVETNVRTMTEKEIWNARIGASNEQKAIDARYYVTGSNGVEHCRNGLGEWIY